jgi:hypothetical protein
MCKYTCVFTHINIHGVYIYILTIKNRKTSKKMLLMKKLRAIDNDLARRIISIANRELLPELRKQILAELEKKSDSDHRTYAEKNTDVKMMIRHEYDMNMVVTSGEPNFREHSIHISERRRRFEGKTIRDCLGRLYLDYSSMTKSISKASLIYKKYRMKDLMYDIEKGGTTDPRKSSQRKRANERREDELSAKRMKRRSRMSEELSSDTVRG